MGLTSGPRWRLSEEALALLLERLGAEPGSAAEEYNALRGKLVDFFDWRGCDAPEVLADETLDRVAQKLEEGREVDNFNAFVYGVARNVGRESARRRAREQRALTDLHTLTANAGSNERAEAGLECLRQCLETLAPESRQLIIGYYQGRGRSHLEGRRRMAEELAISYENLKTRAHRVRARLGECLARCIDGGGVTNGAPESLSGRRTGQP